MMFWTRIYESYSDLILMPSNTQYIYKSSPASPSGIVLLHNAYINLCMYRGWLILFWSWTNLGYWRFGTLKRGRINLTDYKGKIASPASILDHKLDYKLTNKVCINTLSYYLAIRDMIQRALSYPLKPNTWEREKGA